MARYSNWRSLHFPCWPILNEIITARYLKMSECFSKIQLCCRRSGAVDDGTTKIDRNNKHI